MLMRDIVKLAVCLVVIALSCTAPRAQTQLEMTATEGEKFKQADKQLNAAYNQLLAKTSPAGQSALRDAQRTWLRFRDQECDFETFGTRDGSVHSMSLLICMTNLTGLRTKQLVAQIECEEGDVTCGHQ
jgi:uncharacterized protein YecT (DUF1311 family)